MKRAVIVFQWDANDGLSLRQLEGNCSHADLNWALDWLKGELQRRANSAKSQVVIPGMLTPDLKRLPGDVQRRILHSGR